jgi:HSP20 family protein
MVSGEVKQDPSEKAMKMWKSERKYGRFGRSIKLPKDASHDQVKASLQQGILQIRIEKDFD